jgi:hypothetical protein
MKTMQSGYFGLDLSQIIFAGGVVFVFIGFAVWGLRTRRRIQKVEQMLRDFRELEPEGYEEEETRETITEGGRLEADEEVARQRDILEHSR